MRTVIAFIVAAIFVLLGLYIGGWVLFIQPIIAACMAFDAGTLTATIVGWTVIKCVVAGFVGVTIAAIGCALFTFIIDD
jgi:hypothetical protein